MILKQQWEDYWESAPVNKFLNYSKLNIEGLKLDGVEVTDEWARALYLLEIYTGGGYLTSSLHMSGFWRIINNRFNVPYAEELAILLFEEQLYTYHGERTVNMLMNRVQSIVNGREIEPNSELFYLLEVILEKTGVQYNSVETAEIISPISL